MTDVVITFEPGWEQNLIPAMGQFLARILDEIADDARRGCPVDTGELVNSIEPKVITYRRGIVKVGTDHWAPTEYGSRPHKIRSHGPWPLRNRETGQVFGFEVHHPGTPEQAFMRPALYRRRTP